MEWVDNLLNQLPNRADTVKWLQNQLTLPTKEQFLADRNAMWGNTPQERMMNYTNMVAGFAGKAPQLLDRALPSALSIALHPDTLAAETRYAARQADLKAVNDQIDEMYRKTARPTYKSVEDVQAEQDKLNPPAPVQPKMEPEVSQPRDPPKVADATTHPPGSQWQWNTNLKDWKSNQTGIDKPMSFNAQPTGLYDANGNVQTRLFNSEGVEFPPYGNNWIHHSELTPAPKPPGGPAGAPEPPLPSEPIQQGWKSVDTGDPEGDITGADYEAKRRAGNPPYDAVFFSPKSGIDRTGRYAGVYYNERLPEVLDEIERHQMGSSVSPADLHGGTLGDAVGKRIAANLNGDFSHYYTAPEGHQVGVNLTGNVHDGLGLSEIITGDGLRGWMPTERLTQIQAPDAPQ